MEVVIDCAEFSSSEELYQALMVRLSLPSCYGMNLDALWDSITGLVAMPLAIIWIGFETSVSTIGDYAYKVEELFREAEKEVPGFRFEKM